MEQKYEIQVNDDFDSPWKEVLEAYFEGNFGDRQIMFLSERLDHFFY